LQARKAKEGNSRKVAVNFTVKGILPEEENQLHKVIQSRIAYFLRDLSADVEKVSVENGDG